MFPGCASACRKVQSLGCTYGFHVLVEPQLNLRNNLVKSGVLVHRSVDKTGVSKSRYFGISIPIKYSNFSRFYKKMGPFYKKIRCDKFGN